jgi:hypothetical protein
MQSLHQLVNGSNYFTGNRSIAKLLGNDTAIFLSELLDKYDFYEQQKKLVNKNDLDGWFFISNRDMTERTNLSRYRQQICIKKLIYEQVIRYYIDPGNSFRYFYIDKAALCVLLAKDEKRDKELDKLENKFGGGVNPHKGDVNSSQHRKPRSETPKGIKDIVLPKRASFKTKTPEQPTKKFKLDAQQIEVFNCLKDLMPNENEGTLCYWAKTYSFERLMEVHRDACRLPRTNFGGYMNALLKRNAFVRSDDAVECAKFAEDFKAAHGWGDLKITTNFVSFNLGSSTVDIPLRQKPETFATQLMEKYKSTIRY